MTNLNLSMFKAYDIRTQASRLTDEIYVRLLRAEALYFKNVLQVPGVVLAHEARLPGPHFVELAAAEFSRAGLDVWVLPGVSSTCLFYFACMKKPDLAGVMCGASHNPAGDHGQKILGPGVVPIAEHIGPEGGLDKVKELYVQGAEIPVVGRPGKVQDFDPLEDYVAYSLARAGVRPDGLKGLEILQDYLNGAAGREMTQAFRMAGANLTPLHAEPDGRFPLGDPNPVKRSVIQEGLDRLKGGHFLLANFFDGDGDRLDVYRGDGAYLASSFAYAAVLPDLRRLFGSGEMGVYADLKSNPLAILEMAKAGFRVSVIRNGHSQIKHALAQAPAMAGAVEESAHFYEAFNVGGRRFASENTLCFALRIAKAWKEHPERLEALFQVQSRTNREREWGYRFPDDARRDTALGAVKEHFENRGLQSLERMSDGTDLEATLMRRGLPFDITAQTRLESGWLQLCQRTSGSENHLARWEAVSADRAMVQEAKSDVARIVARFGAGEEYQG
jgi:phosphomannomutase